jgi:hypothetical protein
MNSKKWIMLIAILALVTLSCSVTVNLPVTNLKVGPTEVDDIEVSRQDTSETTELVLSFGAGELALRPASMENLVQGRATYNVMEFKPEIITSGNRIEIKTGDLEINGIPDFGGDYVNKWDLNLAEEVPMDLKINAGAYKSDLELGGLTLENLQITDGAADVRARFSRQNQTSMDTLRYETGASSVELYGLANANFENMIFKGGAGSYTLEFSGDLRQDATINIDAGVSNVVVIVPNNVNARIFFDGGLTNIDVSGNWEKSGKDYYQDAGGLRLTFNVNMGAGKLEIRN